MSISIQQQPLCHLSMYKSIHFVCLPFWSPNLRELKQFEAWQHRLENLMFDLLLGKQDSQCCFIKMSKSSVVWMAQNNKHLSEINWDFSSKTIALWSVLIQTYELLLFLSLLPGGFIWKNLCPSRAKIYPWILITCILVISVCLFLPFLCKYFNCFVNYRYSGFSQVGATSPAFY